MQQMLEGSFGNCSCLTAIDLQAADTSQSSIRDGRNSEKKKKNCFVVDKESQTE